MVGDGTHYGLKCALFIPYCCHARSGYSCHHTCCVLSIVLKSSKKQGMPHIFGVPHRAGWYPPLISELMG